MPRPRLAAVSVDLDEVTEYTLLHDLPPFPEKKKNAVYDTALSRIEAWANSLSIPITFFAVGRDLARPESASLLRRLAEKGHRVESHSQNHRYDLTRLSKDEIRAEVMEGLLSVERATGIRPVGFRAPGYTVSDVLFDVLDEAGVSFDSSVLPSPVYFGAKALVLALMRLRRRLSASILDTPRVLLSPRVPYRPGRPYYDRRAPSDGGRRFVELPILVTPIIGFPVIGTTLGRAGALGRRALVGAIARSPFVNLELHGMDFLDAEDIAPHPLTKIQPELLSPLEARLERLSEFVSDLQMSGCSFTTLAEAALAFARTS